MKEKKDSNQMHKVERYQFFIVSYGLFFLIILALSIVAIVITGAFPCVHTKCHQNATCYNTPFYGDCVCNYGHAGNGIDHCDECGVTFYENNADKNGKISVPYSWPAAGILEFSYYALEDIEMQRILLYEYDQCGTVLINRKTALTAAHCIKKKFKYYDYYYDKYYEINVTLNNFIPSLESMYTMYFGTHQYVSYYIDLPHVQMGDIKDVIIHPDYNDKSYENDIAIVKFFNEIKLNRQVQIACLPEKKSNSIPKLSKNYGYIAGFSSAGSSYNSNVQYNMLLDLYNNSMCANVSEEKRKNWNVQFCAGEYNEFGNLTGNCHGDYGSALYTKEIIGNKEKYIATGLLSYDAPCSTNHSPGVYTRISSYIEWINENSRY